MTLLDVRNLVTGYGDVEIVHGVSLDVYENEIVTVIGPNGAGKSTLLKAIFGLIERWDGQVWFSDKDISDYRADEVTKTGICFVPQTDNVFPSLTVQENLRMGAYVLDEFPDDMLRAIFDQFPILKERQNQQAGKMSGGQRQMVAMGRGLIADPDLMIIDEPSAGLSPDLVDDIFRRLVTVKNSGTSVLMVEQNARKALQTSDRGYVLEMGEKRFEDTGKELLNDERVAELYLGG